LFAVDLILLFAGIFGKLRLVAHHGASIAIERSDTQPGVALRDVQFALQRRIFFFLVVDLLFQVFVFLLLGGGRIFLGCFLVSVCVLVVGFLCRLRFAAGGRRGAARHGVIVQLDRA